MIAIPMSSLSRIESDKKNNASLDIQNTSKVSNVKFVRKFKTN